ncbi:hypothetical protein N0V90_000811 [Kalmusia sp. IMI 367209]|nr:hypothetical protein N0V90_000811 [Kalmusia sp. IMI 367209]
MLPVSVRPAPYVPNLAALCIANLRQKIEDLQHRLEKAEADTVRANNNTKKLAAWMLWYQGQLLQEKAALQQANTSLLLLLAGSREKGATTSLEGMQGNEVSSVDARRDPAFRQADEDDIDEDSYSPSVDEHVPSLEEQVDKMIAEEGEKVMKREKRV